MNVDKVKSSAFDAPAGPQEALSTPLALGKEMLRKFGLLLCRHRLDVARMNCLALNALILVGQKVPYFYVRNRIVGKIQISQCLKINHMQSIFWRVQIDLIIKILFQIYHFHALT